MPNISYLKRRKNGNYYYRRRVPDELKEFVGQNEFKLSLKTSNFDTAKAKLASINLKVENQLAAARKQQKECAVAKNATQWLEDLELFEIERMCQLWFHRKAEKNENVLAGIFLHDDFDYEEALYNCKDTLVMLDTKGHPATVKWIAKEADALVRLNRLSAKKESHNYSTLQQLIYEGLKELEERTLKHYEKKVGTIPATKNIANNKRYIASNLNNPSNKHKNTITIKGLIKEYLNDSCMSHLTEKSRYEYEKKLNFLTQMLGNDRIANEVTRKDIQFVVGVLRQLPKKTAGRCTLSKYEKIIQDAKRDNKKPITINTVNHYIDLFAALFAFGEDVELISKNPVKKVRLRDNTADDEKREPFEIKELQAIFTMPLYTGCKNDCTGYNKPGDNVIRRHRFWIPLISLYTGMRQKEICQLTTESVISEGNVDYVSLKVSRMEREAENQAEQRRLKTKAARRIIPIHHELKRIGFMKYVEERRADKSKWLFPDIVPAGSGSRSANFQKWVARFLEQSGQKHERNSFHSFRHNFGTALTNAGVPYEHATKMGGWENHTRSTYEIYSKGFEPQILNKSLQKIRYEGLDLSHLYVE